MHMGAFPKHQSNTSTASEPSAFRETSTQRFDAVVVANGHYSEPNIPTISGADVFPGLQMHSHNYRSPNVFTRQQVLIVGASNSGEDISREVGEVAARVLVAARSWQVPGTLCGPGSPCYGARGNLSR